MRNSDMLGDKNWRLNDPREAILRHADAAKQDPWLTRSAYAETQPGAHFPRVRRGGRRRGVRRRRGWRRRWGCASDWRRTDRKQSVTLRTRLDSILSAKGPETKCHPSYSLDSTRFSRRTDRKQSVTLRTRLDSILSAKGPETTRVPPVGVARIPASPVESLSCHACGVTNTRLDSRGGRNCAPYRVAVTISSGRSISPR